MKIINNTSLNYSTIGSIIDNIISNTQGTTHYVGQKEWTILEINGHKTKIFRNVVDWDGDLMKNEYKYLFKI